jgi:hypothetical protein
MTKATSMPAFPAVRTLADVEAIERTPLAERLDAKSSYEVLHRAGLVARVSTAAPSAARGVLGRFAIAYELAPPYATE